MVMDIEVHSAMYFDDLCSDCSRFSLVIDKAMTVTPASCLENTEHIDVHCKSELSPPERRLLPLEGNNSDELIRSSSFQARV